MLISTRPSFPTSTPCGIEGRSTLDTRLFSRSITFSSGDPLAVCVGVAPLVTYSHRPSIEIAPATGLFPTPKFPTTVLEA
jgi:hypothetical protein